MVTRLKTPKKIIIKQVESKPSFKKLLRDLTEGLLGSLYTLLCIKIVKWTIIFLGMKEEGAVILFDKISYIFVLIPFTIYFLYTTLDFLILVIKKLIKRIKEK